MSVYFFVCREAKAVKIGTSVDPHGRLPEIQRGCPLPVKLGAVIPGNHREERALHERFADDRIHGEWFHLTEIIEAIIAANPPGPAPQKVPLPGHMTARDRMMQRARQERETAKAEAERLAQHQKEMRLLEKRGDIIFPFRAKEPA